MEKSLVAYQKNLINDLLENDKYLPKPYTLRLIFGDFVSSIHSFSSRVFCADTLYLSYLPEQYHQKVIDYLSKSINIETLLLEVIYPQSSSDELIEEWRKLFYKITSRLSENKSISTLHLDTSHGDQGANGLAIDPIAFKNTFSEISKIENLIHMKISVYYLLNETTRNIMYEVIQTGCNFKKIQLLEITDHLRIQIHTHLLYEKLYLRNLNLPYMKISLDYLAEKCNFPTEIKEIIWKYCLIIE